MDLDPTTLSDEDLDALISAALTEQEHRRIPASITHFAHAYLAGGGDIADLTAAITQTPEEPTP